MNTNYHLCNLPNSWEWRRIKYVLKSLESGGRENSKEDSFEGQALSIGGEHIGWKGEWLLTDNPRFVSFEYFNSMRSGHIRKMDVLLVKDGATIGKTAIADELPYEKIAVNEHVFILRFDSSVLPRFGFYVIQSRMAQEQIYLEVRGSAQPGLNTEFRHKVQFPLPPLATQLVITNFLDRETTQIDNLIAAKEQMLTLLEEKREALISHAVTRGLDPNVAFKQSGLDWLGDIPQHWSIERAKGLFREVDNRTTSGEEELLSLRMHVGLVPHHDVSDKILEPKDVIGFKKVETGQLVINRMRASMGLIAISPQNGLVSPDYAVFDIVKLIHIPYFLALFNTSLVGALFRSSSKGLGTGSSGFLRLYSESFLSIHFPVPSLDEQKEITNFLDQEQQRTGELEKALTDSISLLKERRSALITAAVTGQITLEEMKK